MPILGRYGGQGPRRQVACPSTTGAHLGDANAAVDFGNAAPQAIAEPDGARFAVQAVYGGIATGQGQILNALPGLENPSACFHLNGEGLRLHRLAGQADFLVGLAAALPKQDPTLNRLTLIDCHGIDAQPAERKIRQDGVGTSNAAQRFRW